MKIYKITEASEYLGVSINTLKTFANKVENYDRSGHCSTLCKIKETDIGINFIG